MASNNIHSRIKHKRDTSANWTANNPVLLDGEIIIVDTANKEVRVKIGDGVSTYTQLPFNDEVIRNLINDTTSTYATKEELEAVGISTDLSDGIFI